MTAGARRCRVGGMVAVLAVGALGLAAEPNDQSIYLGTESCRPCHDGAEHGHQYAVWRASRHAQAYACLFGREAQEIARLSGVPEQPHQSRICLGCHSTASESEAWQRADSFHFEDGMQCEHCHGPRSAHVDAATAGQKPPRSNPNADIRAQCMVCHLQMGSHDAVLPASRFVFEDAWKSIAHPTGGSGRIPATQATSRPAVAGASPVLSPALIYKTPVNLAVSPDGRTLLVACEAANTVVVVDAVARRRVAEIKVGAQPHDVTFSPDGRWAYVSCRLADGVDVIDVPTLTVTGRIAVGFGPHGLLTDPTGRRLFVLDSGADRISVCDAEGRKELKRLAAGRMPWSLALSPDGREIFATNSLPQFGPFRSPSVSEVTVIDVNSAAVSRRMAISGANLCQGIAFHPSGRFALITLLRTKNLLPMTRMVRGGTITNGLGIVWRDGRVDEVLLDEPNQYFPDPADVAISPDGRRAYVTSGGSNRLAIVDIDKLVGILGAASDEERQHVLPNHLGKSTEFVLAHIDVKDSPRGVAVSPNGEFVYVANALDDSVSVIDAQKLAVVDRVDLGGPTEITRARRGERLFHSAKIAFQRQLSCHSCHPDGHIDGLTYDIEADGIGVNPVDNRTLRGILDTAPFKWVGTNPSLSRQCGARLAVFFTRVDPFTPEELSAVDEYVCTVLRPPNPHRAGDELTAPQRRGKALFERTVDNTGQTIPPNGRCMTCHPPPYYTNRQQMDVGTKLQYDTQGVFDVPHLNNIFDSAPYLHNGISPTLEEIWTRFNLQDRHGRTNDMTKDQLNDLVEYLKTL